MSFHSRVTLRSALRATLAAAAVVAVGSLAACGGADDGADLLRVTIKVNSITQQGQCEDVNVKVTPETILPGAPKLANTREFVTEVKLTKAADGVSCTGQSVSVQTVAPGKWKFLAPLPSDTVTCERDIAKGAPNEVSFKDGESTCS